MWAAAACPLCADSAVLPALVWMVMTGPLLSAFQVGDVKTHVSTFSSVGLEVGRWEFAEALVPNRGTVILTPVWLTKLGSHKTRVNTESGKYKDKFTVNSGGRGMLTHCPRELNWQSQIDLFHNPPFTVQQSLLPFPVKNELYCIIFKIKFIFGLLRLNYFQIG